MNQQLYLPMVIDQNPNNKKKNKLFNISKFLELFKEPVVTYCITPNNSPSIPNDDRAIPRNTRNQNRRPNQWEESIYSNSEKSDMLLNTISGLFARFYAPERIRLLPDGLKVKMNDCVSYKVVVINGQMKFYLTVPKKWSKGFISAIKKDWGQVDITKVEEKIVNFNLNKTKAMEVHLRHHYALSLKYDDNQNDSFYSSIASIASTLNDKDKLLIDYNIEPINNAWKEKAHKKIKQFKDGKAPIREDTFTLGGVIGRTLDMFNIIMDEFVNMIEALMGTTEEKEVKKEELFELKYSNNKLNANSKGYKMQIRVLCESDDEKKIKHVLRNVENSFSVLDGDNKFTVTHVKTKRGIRTVIRAVEDDRPIITRTKDVYFEKEVNNFLRLPNKQTLKEYNRLINQDNFTRTEIDSDFLKDEYGAIPFAKTLDKVTQRIYFAGYERLWWTEKGRYVEDKTKLDDRSTATMIFGGMGSGKTSSSESQALYTFGCHLPNREAWKEQSKSVILFDVADGGMINNVYNRVPDWLKDRVVILNHSNFNNPIAVNNADLSEFNTKVMKDDDYAYTLAEMEARLVLEILQSDKSISMDRWFISALQCVHEINHDWGYIEAMRTLVDDDFREEKVLPNIKNKRLELELKTYNSMAIDGKATQIIQTIENRFSQLERDQKLWDCIAQKPLRDEDGNVKLNFRTMMDGDEDGAYLILVYIPKSGVSQLYRKFLFAHYFTKVWNVALSRESGFAGREYRPETLVIIDEIHQIIDIPLVGKLFIDLFKEPRKYSLRLWLTLHGWSSLAKAGRGLEGDIKQSIMDNGCNLIMLKGGWEAFESLKDFLYPMTIADFNNLMNMEFCGIFRVSWQNKNHVFQARLLEHIDKNKDFKKYRDCDSNFLTKHNSNFGRLKEEVRQENLDRSYEILQKSISSAFNHDDNGGEDNWEELKDIGKKVDGSREKKSRK